jgi:hypothetical protein
MNNYFLTNIRTLLFLYKETATIKFKNLYKTKKTHSNQQISQREIIKLLQDDCIISLYLEINIQKYK